MPKSSHHVALARQWELLKRLPSRPPGVTAAEMTAWLGDEGYAVSKRTVERDLVDLSALFPLRCNDSSVPYGWYWMPGREAGLPDLDLAEALSLQLSEKALRTALPPAVLESLEPRFLRAREKLATAKGTPHSRWRNKIRFAPPSLPMLPPPVDPGILRSLQNALLSEHRISAHYHAFGALEARPMTLHPLALVQRGVATHLIATAFDYDDIRQYAVHRFESVHVESATARRPKGFDIDQYLASGATGFGNPHPIRLKARLNEGLAGHLTETPLAQGQKLTRRKDVFHLEVEVQDTWQLRWWILSQSPAITILGPRSLANEIREALTDAVRQYTLKNGRPK